MSRWPAKASGCPRVAGKSLSKSQVQSACVGVDPQFDEKLFLVNPLRVRDKRVNASCLPRRSTSPPSSYCTSNTPPNECALL